MGTWNGRIDQLLTPTPLPSPWSASSSVLSPPMQAEASSSLAGKLRGEAMDRTEREQCAPTVRVPGDALLTAAPHSS